MMQRAKFSTADPPAWAKDLAGLFFLPPASERSKFSTTGPFAWAEDLVGLSFYHRSQKNRNFQQLTPSAQAENLADSHSIIPLSTTSFFTTSLSTIGSKKAEFQLLALHMVGRPRWPPFSTAGPPCPNEAPASTYQSTGLQGKLQFFNIQRFFGGFHIERYFHLFFLYELNLNFFFHYSIYPTCN